jgi:hypothetical protein
MAKKTTIQNIYENTALMGDKLFARSIQENCNDLKIISTSLNAYKTALSAEKIMQISKKLTGKPDSKNM